MQAIEQPVTPDELDYWLDDVLRDERHRTAGPSAIEDGIDPDCLRGGRPGPGGSKQGSWRRRSSLDCPPGEEPVFGIDARTLLASDADGEEADAVTDVEDSAAALPDLSPFPRSRRVSAESDRSGRTHSTGDITFRHNASTPDEPALHRAHTSSGAETTGSFQEHTPDPFLRRASLPVRKSSGDNADGQPLRHSTSLPVRSRGPGSRSRLLEAMRRSRRTQGHDVHSRRSYKLMRKTNRTRKVLLLDMLMGDAPSATCKASVPRGRRAPYPSYGRCCPRNAKIVAENAVPAKRDSHPGVFSWKPVSKPPRLPQEGDAEMREAEWDAIEANIRRTVREQMAEASRRAGEEEEPLAAVMKLAEESRMALRTSRGR